MVRGREGQKMYDIRYAPVFGVFLLSEYRYCSAVSELVDHRDTTCSHRSSPTLSPSPEADLLILPQQYMFRRSEIRSGAHR